MKVCRENKKRARLGTRSLPGTAKHLPEGRAKPRRLGAVACNLLGGSREFSGFGSDPL